MNDGSCPLAAPDLSGVEIVELQSEGGIGDFRQARQLAEAEAARRFAEFMLISWYDRERDYESPPNTTEACGAKSGYIYYALSRGARLKVGVDGGRFVFFYTPVEW
jgi:hypothetical protein